MSSTIQPVSDPRTIEVLSGMHVHIAVRRGDLDADPIAQFRSNRAGRSILLTIMLTLAACTSGSEAVDTAAGTR